MDSLFKSIMPGGGEGLVIVCACAVLYSISAGIRIRAVTPSKSGMLAFILLGVGSSIYAALLVCLILLNSQHHAGYRWAVIVPWVLLLRKNPFESLMFLLMHRTKLGPYMRAKYGEEKWNRFLAYESGIATAIQQRGSS
ncbi:MAG: hypothetical protein JSS72_09340 [Armatimonadetes bacterium]|nr:hypothetical protein [Armatimonadota bacterium]